MLHAIIKTYKDGTDYDGTLIQWSGVFEIINRDSDQDRLLDSWSYPAPACKSHDELRCEAYFRAVNYCVRNNLRIVRIENWNPLDALARMVAFGDPKPKVPHPLGKPGKINLRSTQVD